MPTQWTWNSAFIPRTSKQLRVLPKPVTVLAPWLGVITDPTKYVWNDNPEEYDYVLLVPSQKLQHKHHIYYLQGNMHFRNGLIWLSVKLVVSIDAVLGIGFHSPKHAS